jgi:pyruvate/2-oxoglutarate dehydrogenase complex dihydrolipoamide dehydrogenase (E3) component
MKYDILIIGSGQAGVPLAVRLAETGRSVLVVEKAKLGGTCVNTGCTPTKTMMASARAAHAARRAARLGVHVGPVEVDLAAVVARKEAIVAQWRSGVQGRLEGAGDKLQWQQGQARFVGPREVQVGDQTHTAATIVVNTGGRPVRPPLPGLDGVPTLDNASIMELREIPSHLVALGGGYIAVEFAQMFRRFGAEVTIVQRGPHLLGREDPEVASALEDAFRAEGIDLRLDAQATSVRRDGDGIRLELRDGSSIAGSHLLVAVGREPNTRDLGCDAAGIRLDARGAIVADAQYRTSAPGVYAVGDVLGGAQFTHNSWDDHRLLYDILMGRERDRHDRLVPYSVFTDPQVARVGLSEVEARAKGIRYEVATMPFGDIARALELDETAGVLKVLIDPATERVLGAAIVGIEAGELIHIFVALMQAGGTARAIVEAQAIHPTLAEGVQSVVMRLQRYAL